MIGRRQETVGAYCHTPVGSVTVDKRYNVIGYSLIVPFIE